jgi:GNAT superfamily N-acetyltransferase
MVYQTNLARRHQIELLEAESSAHATDKAESKDHDGERVAIRLASVADALVLARLRYDFRYSINEATEDDELFVPRCKLWMQERLQHSSFWRCWIAEREQTPVANLWAQLIEKVPNPTSEPEYHLYLTNFYVRKDWRGKGIGSMLLSAALTWSQTKNVHAAILWPSEQSLSFYLKRGFCVGGDDLMVLKIGNGQ